MKLYAVVDKETATIVAAANECDALTVTGWEGKDVERGRVRVVDLAPIERNSKNPAKLAEVGRKKKASSPATMTLYALVSPVAATFVLGTSDADALYWERWTDEEIKSGAVRAIEIATVERNREWSTSRLAYVPLRKGIPGDDERAERRWEDDALPAEEDEP